MSIAIAPPLDMDAVRRQIEDRYISVRQHPTADLFIYNYTAKAQFDKWWTPEATVCRGLILDGQDRVVQRPFRKFFNLEEHTGPLPTEPFEVYEKMDGSLGILYWAGDEPAIASRGSFISEQATWGTATLYRQYAHTFGNLDRSLTYLFEIIEPRNRIVVDYGDTRDLVLLATIHTETGAEIPLSDAWGFPLVKRYDGIADLAELTAHQGENREGYVVRFASGLRLKVKFDEYVRLHRLVTGVNQRHVWECLRANTPVDDLMTGAPPAYQKWVDGTADDLLRDYNRVTRECVDLFNGLDRSGDRKSIALQIVRHPQPHQAVLFGMHDGRPYSDTIWKSLRPEYARPFKVVE